jgi:hypothetical protein
MLGSGVFGNLPPEDIRPEPGQSRGVGAVNRDCDQRIAHVGIPLPPGLDGGTAAVGGDDRPGDVAGLGRGEEGDDPGDLAGLGGPGQQGRGAEGLDAGELV